MKRPFSRLFGLLGGDEPAATPPAGPIEPLFKPAAMPSEPPEAEADDENGVDDAADHPTDDTPDTDPWPSHDAAEAMELEAMSPEDARRRLVAGVLNVSAASLAAGIIAASRSSTSPEEAIEILRDVRVAMRKSRERG